MTVTGRFGAWLDANVCPPSSIPAYPWKYLVLILLAVLGAGPSSAESLTTRTTPPATTPRSTSSPRPAPRAAPEHASGQPVLRDQKREAQNTDAKPAIAGLHEPPAPDHSKEKADSHSADSKWNRQTLFNFLLMCFTGLLVVVGGVQASVLCQTIKATRALERPWVIVTPKFDGWAFAPARFPLPLTLQWSATNYGRSPAWLIRGAVDFQVMVRDGMPKAPTYPPWEPCNEFPLPNAETPHSDISGVPVSQVEHQKILAGSACLVFYGRIEYRDVLGQSHQTRFCFVWQVESTGLGQSLLVYRPGGPQGWTSYT